MIPTFPQSISLTITNHCNLRCQMCGQWSQEGYIRGNPERLKHEMTLADWKRVIDELVAHDVPDLLLRGGEPFMFPQIIELLEYIHDKGVFISIDTNGTMLARHAGEIARIGGMHLTISVDGPEAIRDEVRRVTGTFQRLKDGIARICAAEEETGNKIGRSICFTISRYNYRFLGAMPEVARSLGIGSIAIVPYHYFPDSTGARYEQELHSLGCEAFSWAGFHHEDSGVEVEEFIRQLHPVSREPWGSPKLSLRAPERGRIPGLVRRSADPGRAAVLPQCRETDRHPARRLGQLLRGFRRLFVRERPGSEPRGAVEWRTRRALPHLPAAAAPCGVLPLRREIHVQSMGRVFADRGAAPAAN